MSIIRFFFWRLLEQPQAGDVFVYREGEHNPFRLNTIKVLEVRDGWVRIKRSYGEDTLSIRSLLAFYRKVSDA